MNTCRRKKTQREGGYAACDCGFDAVVHGLFLLCLFGRRLYAPRHFSEGNVEQAADFALLAGNVTDATQFTAPTIPQDGANLYVRLYQEVDQRWQFTDYLFTEPGAITPAELTTPTTNPLGTTDVQFEWTPGAGPQMYELWLGTSGPGSDELYHSGPTRATSVTVPSIPANGVKVYARFLQRINLLWQYTDAVYTESGSPTPAVLTSPTPGASTILGTTNVQFQWTQEGGSTLYEFRLGTTPCSYNLYISGGTKETSATAPTIPARSATVYACLLLLIDEEWQHTVYTYTELSPPSP